MDEGKQFAVWLEGFLDGKTTLDATQTEKVKNKLDGIFDHEAMDAITADKPTLTELGDEHDFEVVQYPPFGESLHGEGPDGEKMRC